MAMKQDVISNGPSGRALKFLNNKNNLADLYLKKRLAQFDREKTFSVSHMDRDKFDTVDILKQIHQCDSDLLPASQRYLDKDRRKDSIVHQKSQRPKKFLHPKTAPSAISHQNENPNDNEQTESKSYTVPLISLKSPRFQETKVSNENHKTPRTKRSAEIQVENTKLSESRQTLTLPNIDRKPSVYLKVATFSKNSDEISVDSEEDSDDDDDTPREKPRRMSSRRKSFMAWIEGNKNPSGSILPEYIREARIGKQERRRNSFFNWLEKRNPTKTELTDLESTENTGLNCDKQERTKIITGNESSRKEQFKKVGNVISTLLYMKRKPLNVRLSDFYEKLDEMKLAQEKYYIGPSFEEQRRKWTLLTKGVKAALAESSDDDDDDDGV